ncbi:SMC family ATPase [Fusobacterium nucleatum subsp. nucleatum ATCC 25586]|uniref:Exonuclease SBCC n=1 Tax=Fusobacterium nucleatum subsp. nucleatum (strain ATCC 25586 / DSM 15643 / BCRC 10681 / CIP 101130 / JCM 8532 / KCTC 2640 / LMG 13131 / VPI 4355) TaxID=190304 RepID=Q8R6A0_FUSNN|nr:SMC family ATPase [Fusobacterium nucleatum]AAL94718.1 Exonuclease SBCC [Fusobacterium nucleatum subsp. nucleatum ATCC 25586]AVQ14964.1 SMC family ATPase [Fusobacterium nucleatum subsp. nucleatum ATCC 25586]WMS29829.1 SMC family ATPase [Fusobacterium nucleatum]
MIIKKVQLENYRSHSNTTVEFTKGVNLILGKNGRGKTSILEAISTVMFNTKDRTGKETGKSYIKFGEKSSKVDIDFIANDGREYNLKTEFFKTKPKKQTLKDMTGSEYDGDIQEKLEELCGIKKGFEETYENIVIAKQNEFINIFKAKPKNREEIFNKIFNTQIYKEMYDSFLKEAVDKYKEKIKDLDKEITFLKENMEDKEQITNFLKEEKELEKNLQDRFKNINVVSKNLENEIKDYETTEIELNNLVKNIKDEENKIKKYLNILKENIIEAKQAKKSKIIVKETEKSYLEYLEIENRLKDLRENLDNLLEEQKLNIQYQNNIEKLELSNKNLKNDIINLEENISKNSEKKENLESEISNLKIKEEDLDLKLKKYISLLDELEKLENFKDKKLEDKLKKTTEIDILKKELISKKDLFKTINIEIIEEKLSNFQELEKELKLLEEQKIIFEIEIKTLKKSSKELSDKICPFLNEKCQNLEDKEAEDYFSSKISIKKEDLENLKKNIKEKTQILVEKVVFEDKKKQYFELEKSIKDLEISLKNEEINLKEIELDIKNLDIDIQKLIENQEFQNSQMLREKKTELEVELRNLNLDEKRENLKNILENLEIEKEKILKNQNSIKSNLEEIDVFSKKIKEDINKNIESIKSEIKTFENKLDDLKNPYNEYLKNNVLAEDLENLLIKVDKNIKELYSLRSDKNLLKEKVFNLEEKIKNIKIAELKEKYDTIKEELNEINKKLGSSQEKIENYKKILEKISSQEEKQKKLLVEFKKLENKFNKASLIRNEVGQMGRAISKYMLSGISNIASVNFNKITGRTERIEWSNEEKDKYAVYLVGQERKIAFEQLSGGEQVSVAIAIRGTMTEYFTNSKFMILDEPTNNLDTERKKLLAEYMGEILNNLEQSIIVTHDDTFREMAEKIIEL